jgi:hypothetical protein
MKIKKKFLVIPIVLVLIITVTFLSIGLLNSNKGTYIECKATEEKDDIKTTVTSKYNYNNEKTIIESIDYSIVLTGKINKDQISASKEFFENTICNKKTQPNNITCTIKTEKNKISVITHEDIKNNTSSLLGLKDLDKLDYKTFKNNQDKDSKCIYK